MKYVNYFKNINNDDIFQLWNKHYGLIYPITKELFLRNSINAYGPASYKVYNDENILVGFILTKIWSDNHLINGYENSGFINLFLVDKAYRNQGIGSRLLELVENEMKVLNKKSLYLGKDYCNYFPGLPVDLKSSANWFIKRGFNHLYDTYDLIKINKGVKSLLPLKTNFVFRLANKDDYDELREFIHRNWPGRWEKEMVDYFDLGGSGKEYAIALDNNKICAFAKVGFPTTNTSLISFSLTWRNRFTALGGIGPLGVDSLYRKRNLGYDIVSFANNLLIDAGATEIIIDWTGLLDFYRIMGYEVFKSYFYMTKEII